MKVLIAIQARSSSTRLPRKAFMKIDNKEITQHVIDACDRACKYINEKNATHKTSASVVMVVPTGDDLVKAYAGKVKIIEGPLQNVLARYLIALRDENPDYVVRITGDCPLIPPQLIQRCIQMAVKYRYDYFSNVDEECRTDPDGFDCEVISKRALVWIGRTAKELPDLEHVTLLIRTSPPKDLKIGHLVGGLDMSGIKFSVDTEEDLKFCRELYEKHKKKVKGGIRKSGKEAVRRY
jgi:glutamate-1-semialdehyde 2,1-aminomutase